MSDHTNKPSQAPEFVNDNGAYMSEEPVRTTEVKTGTFEESMQTRQVDSDKSVATPGGVEDSGKYIQFYLPGRDGSVESIVIRGDDDITIGRPDPSNGFIPTIDLTPYHGILLGVSRQHAVIRQYEGMYYLEDLNSSNGTWWNDMPLKEGESVRLTRGDQLRFAQLMVFVYLRDATNQPDS